MNLANFLLGISHIFVGILLIFLSIPLVMRQMPMNKVYGIRFKKAFESDENWYKVNAYGGKQLIVWSIPLIFFGVATFFLPLEENEHWIPLVACAPLIILVPVVIRYFYSRKLWKA